MSDPAHFWHDFIERPIIWEGDRAPVIPPIEAVPEATSLTGSRAEEAPSVEHGSHDPHEDTIPHSIEVHVAAAADQDDSVTQVAVYDSSDDVAATDAAATED